jgi:hypothetical protein
VRAGVPPLKLASNSSLTDATHSEQRNQPETIAERLPDRLKIPRSTNERID